MESAIWRLTILPLACAIYCAPAARGQDVLQLAVEAPAGGDAQVNAIIGQLEPQLKAELSFANRACGWNDEERRDAIEAARVWLAKYAREHADDNALRGQGLMLFAGAAPAGMDRQGSRFEDELAEALEEKMSEAQRSAYRKEREHRRAFHADAVRANIVAQMDQRLHLTSAQCDKISASLQEHWDDDWAPPLQLFVQMPQYMPAFPDAHLLAHLTAKQRVVWQGVQKLSARGFAFGRGWFGQNVEVIDDIDVDGGG